MFRIEADQFFRAQTKEYSKFLLKHKSLGLACQAWPMFVPSYEAIHWKNHHPVDKCMALQKILSRKRKDVSRRK